MRRFDGPKDYMNDDSLYWRNVRAYRRGQRKLIRLGVVKIDLGTYPFTDEVDFAHILLEPYQNRYLSMCDSWWKA